MRRGLLLDNVGPGESVPQSSIDKLRVMGATAVGTLWTAGTRHGRDVYQRCEEVLVDPYYVVRVGGHRQTAREWLRDAKDADSAAADVPSWRLAVAVGNEPNLEGWADDAEGYGATYAAVRAEWSGALFACPSLGKAGWSDWLARALAAAGGVQRACVNLYAGNVGRIEEFTRLFEEVFVGEVNSAPWVRGEGRRGSLAAAFDRLESARVSAAVVFIAGGRSNGAWDEGYIVTAAEVAGLGRAVVAGDVVTFPPAPLGTAEASGAELSVTNEGARVAKYVIGNLAVEDLRGELPDVGGVYQPVDFRVKDFISIHHTASPADTTPRALYEAGLARFGGGISYNFLVYAGGRTVYAGECNTERAAVGQIAEGNRRGIHVALVGDFTATWPPRLQLEAARLLVANIQHAYGWWLPVVPHCLFNSGSKWDTACPGALWREWWPKVLRAVGE